MTRRIFTILLWLFLLCRGSQLLVSNPSTLLQGTLIHLLHAQLSQPRNRMASPETIETLLILGVALTIPAVSTIPNALPVFLTTGGFICINQIFQQQPMRLAFTKHADYRPKADAGLFAGICLIPMVLMSLHSNRADLALQMGIWTLANVAWTSRSYPTLLFLAPQIVQKFMQKSNHFEPIAIICQVILTVTINLLPTSFTLGEASVLCQTVTLLAHDAVMSTIYNHDRPPIYILLQSLILGMLLIGLLTAPILKQKQTVLWLATVAFILLTLITPWTWYRMQSNPITWTVQFILSSPTRIYLALYWIACLLLVLLTSSKLTAPSKDIKTLHYKRKFYHLVAIIMFTPGWIIEPEFMYLSFAVALSAFIFLEYVREARLPPFGEQLDSFLKLFVDERDAGKSILAHIYLLLGCAMPMWFALLPSHPPNLVPLPGLAGLLTIGVGDAMASLVGLEFGTIKWPGVSKSIQGTLGYTLGILVALVAFHPLNLHLFLSVLLTGLVEAFSRQNDNLLLPLLAFVLFQSTGQPN